MTPYISRTARLHFVLVGTLLFLGYTSSFAQGEYPTPVFVQQQAQKLSNPWSFSLQVGGNLALNAPAYTPEPFASSALSIPPYPSLNLTAWHDVTDHLSFTAELGWFITQTPLNHRINSFYNALHNPANPLRTDYPQGTKLSFATETTFPISVGVRFRGGPVYIGTETFAFVRSIQPEYRYFQLPDQPAQQLRSSIDVVWGLGLVIGTLIPINEHLDIDLNLRYTGLIGSPQTGTSNPLLTGSVWRLSAGIRYRF